MLRRSLILTATLVTLFSTTPSFAFRDGAIAAGLGVYSQNVLGRVAQNEEGTTGFLGESSYPLTFKYDYGFGMDWFISPQLSFTPVPRQNPGSTSSISLLHLVFPVGQNWSSMESTWDWSVGPGLLQYDIKGKGGTMELNNGTSTAIFAVPGRTVSMRKVTLNFGGSVTMGSSRFGLDLILENAFSSGKRTQSLMLGYSYIFGGDLFGGEFF